MAFDLARLRAQIKPFRLHWFSRLKSTSDHAARMRRESRLYAPAAVLTGRQLAGRGRGHNRWAAPAGCLTVTFALPIRENLQPHQLPLVAGLAVREACVQLTGSQDIHLKWPNDLLYDGRKLAGLLCERIDKSDLVGLGLNVNTRPGDFPPALRGSTASLREIAGQELDMTAVPIAVAKHLHRLTLAIGEVPFAELLRDYDRHHALAGRRVRVVVNDGRLLVRERGTLHHVISGHVVAW
jgi:BirA family biotin operon repressor/biotin-[acetyl-CoA-carboxylase] ligase